MLTSPVDGYPVTTFVLFVLLSLAVREDMLSHRIPNRLTVAVLSLGLAFALLDGGIEGGLAAVGGVLVGGSVLLPFYLAGKVGAGDVKLMGAVGAFLGPMDALLASAIALIAGATLAIGILLVRAVQSGQAVDAISPSNDCPAVWRAIATMSIARKERFPYAAAIAVGAMFAAVGIA